MGPEDADARALPVNESGPEAPIDPILRRRLLDSADLEGFVSFDRFMEVALYHPGRGFYDRPETRLGRTGDFYTASHVHRLFGATLVAHFREVWKSLGCPSSFHIVEVGPGDGTLAEDVRKSLEDAPTELSPWDHILVERSATLEKAIQARLGDSTAGRFPWRFAPSLAAIGPFRGVVVANELLDALPFRRFQKDATGWAELGVGVFSEGPLVPARRPAPQVVDPPELPADAPDGSQLEVSPTMEAWVREVSDHLVSGRVVLIDYGDAEEHLLRLAGSGTLEAIRGHRIVAPLSAPGTADLSAWVNFTRLRRAAERVGLRESFYGPLSEALVRWGIDGVRERLAVDLDSVATVKLQLAMKSFLLGFPTFKVLELSPPQAST